MFRQKKLISEMQVDIKKLGKKGNLEDICGSVPLNWETDYFKCYSPSFSIGSKLPRALPPEEC